MRSSLLQVFATSYSLLFLSASSTGHRHIQPRHIHNHENRAAVPVEARATTTSKTSSIVKPIISTSASPTSTSSASNIQRMQQDILVIARTVNDLSALFNETLANSTTSSSTTSSTMPSMYCQMVEPGTTTSLIPCPTYTSSSSSTSASHSIATSSSSVIKTSSPVSTSSILTASPKTTSQATALTTSVSVAAINYTAPYASGGLTAEGAATATTVYHEQPTSGYTFDAQSDSNVAVYYGSSPATQQDGIIALCENPNVDIVNLAFLTVFNVSGYPAVNFGNACWAPNTAQAAAAGANLQDCSNVAWEVQGCQAMGKKVLLSLGGSTSTGSFASDAEAETFASTLWSLFGGNPDSNTTTLPLRPFGPEIVLDGFDIDVEDKNTTGWGAFATAMRSFYATDTSKTYYLSAAPQCPIPDVSIPQAALQQCDFVWVQFYDNPSCNVGSSDFVSQFSAWSNLLRNNSNVGVPRLYVGGIAENAGSGYVDGEDFVSNVSAAKALPNLGNFGGVMLWDGSEGLANIDETGTNYLEYAKMAANGTS